MGMLIPPRPSCPIIISDSDEMSSCVGHSVGWASAARSDAKATGIHSADPKADAEFDGMGRNAGARLTNKSIVLPRCDQPADSYPRRLNA
jgi:hypothetical protein